jgi:YHS domain-containing protein
MFLYKVGWTYISFYTLRKRRWFQRSSKKRTSTKKRKEVMVMAKDPVCNMEVDEKKAAATYDYKGKKYYFCATGCKERFAKDPERFIKEKKK